MNDSHTNSLPCISLNRYAQERAKKRHPWVFSNEIGDPKRFQQFEPGSLVDVLDCRGDYLGTGFVNTHSLIAVRILSRKRGEDIGGGFFQEKLGSALAAREPFFGKSSPSRGTYRAVFGESDGLPGLVIDRFQGAWVVEPHALGMYLRKSEIVEGLKEFAGSDAIIFRTDHRSAQLEGMPVEAELFGKIPAAGVFAVEDDIRFPVDPLKGQKSGFVFDQRDNRTFFRNWVAGKALTGAKVSVADLYCHLGAWGLRALKAGASRATFVDSSASALESVKAAAKELGVLERAEFVEMDVGEFLKKQKERSYTAIALDPPALVPNKKSLPAGSKAYRDLNAMAFRAAGEVLSSSSCSYHLQEDRFEEVVAKAAIDAGRECRLLYRGGLSSDHPLIPNMPEGRYLKNLFLSLR
jgi:23S rRNA (cytosine1962-C5)-methyltransferase